MRPTSCCAARNRKCSDCGARSRRFASWFRPPSSGYSKPFSRLPPIALGQEYQRRPEGRLGSPIRSNPSLKQCADCFGLRIQLQSFVSHFASPARLLVSAKRQGRVENVVAVNPDRSGAHLLGGAMRLADVTRPNGGGETVGAVVGTRQDFLRITERHRGHDRSEDFLAYDLHVLVGADQNGGLHEVSFVALLATAGNRLGTLGEASFQVSANPVELLFGNQRPHLRSRFESGADLDFLGLRRHPVHDLVEDGLFYVQARTCATALPMIEEDRTGCAGNGRVEIRVL